MIKDVVCTYLKTCDQSVHDVIRDVEKKKERKKERKKDT